MNKAKQIALGGWFSNSLSIMTRGWFGTSAQWQSLVTSLRSFVLRVDERDFTNQVNRNFTVRGDERSFVIRVSKRFLTVRDE